MLDAAMSKGVDLVSRHGRLFLFHAGLHSNADPGVWNVPDETRYLSWSYSAARPGAWSVAFSQYQRSVPACARRR
jgi:hypothetical protein